MVEQCKNTTVVPFQCSLFIPFGTLLSTSFSSSLYFQPRYWAPKIEDRAILLLNVYNILFLSLSNPSPSIRTMLVLFYTVTMCEMRQIVFVFFLSFCLLLFAECDKLLPWMCIQVHNEFVEFRATEHHHIQFREKWVLNRF